MRTLLSIILFFGMLNSLSAQNVNDYKYVLIPQTFEFTGEIDEYRLNSLTKFLLEKEGFNTYMKTETKPADLAENPCKALNALVQDASTMFVTKLILVLEDCYGKVVFKSEEGRSKSKDFKTAYHEALRDAFISVAELEYKYEESTEKSKKTKITASPEKVKADEVVKTSKEKDAEVFEVTPTDAKPNTVTDFKHMFEHAGEKYQLKPSDEVLRLFQENSPEPIALLIKSSDGRSYIYRSLTNQGVAHFDSENDLVIEIFNARENKKETLIFNSLDQ
ncbi:hypothetical protein [Christiangramia salexigens]|uniref:DUF4476 domain-containing protein n=1 Tax=Christiangramia salexigens TaxID=1913577 RepID=A0A1L3J7M9_9FLAO|nr:hypothetical protein [Christiangramia salexigens]APG61146.1 hypothetical protein LPB144_12370 [Christiangramia salexigens]